MHLEKGVTARKSALFIKSSSFAVESKSHGNDLSSQFQFHPNKWPGQKNASRANPNSSSLPLLQLDENHLISGRTPHFRPQGIASAQDRQHSGQGAIGGCDIGEAAFQGRVEKRARIGLRRGSWHRFETRFAVRRTTPERFAAVQPAPSRNERRPPSGGLPNT